MGLAECLDDVVANEVDKRSVDREEILSFGIVKLSTCEIWRSKDSDTPTITEKDLATTDALSWAKSRPTAEDGYRPGEAGAKILIAHQCDENDHNHNEDVKTDADKERHESAIYAAFREVTDEFSLSHALWEYSLTGFQVIPSNPSVRSEDPWQMHSYRFITRRFAIIWRYDCAAKVYLVAIVTFSDECDEYLSHVKECVRRSWELVNLPYFPAIAMFTFAMRDTRTTLRIADIDGNDLEKETGFTFLATDVKDAFDIRAGKSTRELGRLSVKAATIAALARNNLTKTREIRNGIQVALNENKLFQSYMESQTETADKSAQVSEQPTRSQYLTKTRDFADYLHMVDSLACAAESSCENTQFRATNQLSVLYNLMAQRDNRMNMELAKDSRVLAVESKRDSSSMKTIAAVTIFFLPGTFIASLFAIPVFDWRADAANDQAVVNERFWIYWAVTVPVTIITLLVWWFWFRYSTSRHQLGLSTALDELENRTEKNDEEPERESDDEGDTDSGENKIETKDEDEQSVRDKKELQEPSPLSRKDTMDGDGKNPFASANALRQDSFPMESPIEPRRKSISDMFSISRRNTPRREKDIPEV